MKRVGIVLLIAMLAVFAGNVNAQIALNEKHQKQMVMTNLSSMPLAFTENRGQWDEKALFKANAGGATFWFCGDEIAYVFTRDTDELIEDDHLTRRQEPLPDAASFDHPRYKKESLVIRAQLIDANPNAEIIGENRLSHNCNYFYGNDPSKWRTDVPNYSAIVYKDVYSGIDLKYYGNGSSMKYDFIINPGADISQIRIRYEGVDDLSISNQGDLQAQTRFGIIHEKSPYIYQETGESKREIAGYYEIKESGVFGFSISDGYNPNYPLIIDPELVYSTYLGGSGQDWGYGIAVDSDGNAYITGVTGSDNFPTYNPYLTDQPSSDAFVTKLSSSGNSLVYSTYLGGDEIDSGHSIAVDADGNAYVTGWTQSTNFPTLNPYQADQPGLDVFVTKFSPSGNSLVYSTYLGGDDYDSGLGLAVDNDGSAYVTGQTNSTNFPTQNAYDYSLYGSTDVFVTKLSSSGNSLVYSTYLGGNEMEFGVGIAVDESGNTYITGQTHSTNFPILNPYQADQPDPDGFVTKLSSSGNSLVYSTYLGGNFEDICYLIAIDGFGNAYIAGKTYSTNFPTQDPFQLNQPDADVFVTKLSSSGNSLVYSTYLGGDGIDGGGSIVVDGDGNAYIAGHTYSTNFPTQDPFQLNQPDADGFITKLSPSGNSLVYSTYLGGDDYDACYRIAVDADGNAYVTGQTLSSDFPTQNHYQANQADADGFVTKIGLMQQPIPTLSEWGMIVLALLVLAIGTVAVIRRRRVVAAE